MEEVVMLNLDYAGEKLPDKHDKILAIDADTIAFTACLAAEVKEDLLPAEFYNEQELAEVMARPGFDETNWAIYTSDYDLCKRYAEEKLTKILDLTGGRAENAKLFFTSGRESFRYIIYPDYKGNRQKFHRPLFLEETKQWLLEKYDGQMAKYVEADDLVVYLKRTNPDCILVAVDKDVLNAVPGIHFNYYESGHFNKDMHWVEVGELDAMLWPYKQAIMGDKSDNIEGIKGLGPKKVDIIFKEVTNVEQAQQCLLETYEKRGYTAEDAELAFNLVYTGNIEYDATKKDYVWGGKICCNMPA